MAYFLKRPKYGLSSKDAAHFLGVKDGIVAALLNPGAVVDTEYVSVRVGGEGKEHA